MIKNSCAIFVLFTLLSSLFILPSCSKKIPQQFKSPEVVVAKVKTEDLSKISSVVGQIVAMEQVELKARVSGFLTKRNFEPGQFVNKGQLLFQIQKEQYKASVLSAKGRVQEDQAQLDYLKIEYNRLKLLYSQNATSQEKFQLAEAALISQEGKLERSTSQYQLAELNLSYTDILTPFDGRIGMYQYSIGNMVNLESKPLAVVTQVNPIWVTFNYSEALFQTVLANYQNILPSKGNNNYALAGDKVSVKIILSNGTEYNHEGRIDFINNVIDPLTGTIQIRAVFPNPDEKLIAGGYVQVKITPYKKNPCMVIPQSALQADQTGAYVFIVNDKNIVEQKYIKLGMPEGENVVITSGLDGNDLVITQGILKVRPGIPVIYTLMKDRGSLPSPHTSVQQDTKISSDSQKAPNN
ncbi:MAG TPA: hypothetical protein DD381_09795 [Lentisphaeria bacterium]|nr:MAG: hypothetical protein A2X47_09745 [Lentisphaerae bacterium GWF2_38_69]HBM16617.1 hypothetical protein [Lentisphaeria bacterium]